MFNLRKRRLKKLEKEYARLLKVGRDLQRNGRIPEYAQVMTEADQIRVQIEELEAQA